jgi:uncharacterized protein RhaS with RHS repeats
MLAALPETTLVVLPSGLTSTTTTQRTVTLTDPTNPFSLNRQTDTTTRNGRQFLSVYETASRTFTATSPAGRQRTTILDALGRVTQSRVNGLAALQFS